MIKLQETYSFSCNVRSSGVSGESGDTDDSPVLGESVSMYQQDLQVSLCEHHAVLACQKSL